MKKVRKDGLWVVMLVSLFNIALIGFAKSNVTITNENDLAADATKTKPTWLKENERIYKNSDNVFVVESDRKTNRGKLGKYLNKIRFNLNNNETFKEIKIYPDYVINDEHSNLGLDFEFSKKYVLLDSWWNSGEREEASASIYNRKGDLLFKHKIINGTKRILDDANDKVVELNFNSGVIKISSIKGVQSLEKRYSNQSFNPTRNNRTVDEDDVHVITFNSVVSKESDCIAFGRIPEGVKDFKPELFVIKMDSTILLSKPTQEMEVSPVYVSCKDNIVIALKIRMLGSNLLDGYVAYDLKGNVLWDLSGHYQIDFSNLVENKAKISRGDKRDENLLYSSFGTIDVLNGKLSQ